MMHLSQFPILWSLLSTLHLIPVLFFSFRLFLVPPFIEFLTYLSNRTSTLVQLSEKWEVTWRRNRSLHSPKVFALEQLARDWTAAIPSIIVHVWLWLMGIWHLQTFLCKMVPRSNFPASRKLPSRVASDFGTGASSLWSNVFHIYLTTGFQGYYHSSQEISVCFHSDGLVQISFPSISYAFEGRVLPYCKIETVKG